MANRRTRRSRRKSKPTEQPALTRHVTESPLARLQRYGSLNVHEYTAADELIAGYQMAAGLPVARDPDLGLPPGELRPDAADDQAARRSDLTVKFAQWKRDFAGTFPLAITVSVLIHEKPLRSIDRRWGWRNGTAKRHLLTGLRHFAALRGNTPRGVTGWKYVPTWAA